jgi:hypothetical protein
MSMSKPPPMNTSPVGRAMTAGKMRPVWSAPTTRELTLVGSSRSIAVTTEPAAPPTRSTSPFASVTAACFARGCPSGNATVVNPLPGV